MFIKKQILQIHELVRRINTSKLKKKIIGQFLVASNIVKQIFILQKVKYDVITSAIIITNIRLSENCNASR